MNVPKSNLHNSADLTMSAVKEVLDAKSKDLPIQDVDAVPFILTMLIGGKDRVDAVIRTANAGYILGYRAAMRDAGKTVADVDAKLGSIGGIDT